MSLAKGSAPNISESFLEQLRRYVKSQGKTYQAGDTLADAAYKQSSQDFLEWIEHNARTSPSF